MCWGVAGRRVLKILNNAAKPFLGAWNARVLMLPSALVRDLTFSYPTDESTQNVDKSNDEEG